jgi:hypothetical protein
MLYFVQCAEKKYVKHKENWRKLSKYGGSQHINLAALACSTKVRCSF